MSYHAFLTSVFFRLLGNRVVFTARLAVPRKQQYQESGRAAALPKISRLLERSRKSMANDFYTESRDLCAIETFSK